MTTLAALSMLAAIWLLLELAAGPEERTRHTSSREHLLRFFAWREP